MSFPVRRRSKHDTTSKKRKSLVIDDEPSVLDLPVLRRKRTLALNRLKKTLEVAELALKDATQINSFLAHYSAVSKINDNFEQTHSDILSLVDSTSEEKEDIIRAEFDEIYFNIETIHRHLIPCNDEQSYHSPLVHDRSSIPNVKLPKIQIPTFSGLIKSWPEFYDIFNSLVHNNEALSDTERMHYLVSCLSGEALGLIRTYSMQGTFYREAYDTLVTRYRDKRELAFTCWKEILNINFKSNSPFEFRSVLDLVSENLNILKGLNLPTDEWDFVLCYLILSKLDSKTRCAYEQSHMSSELPSYKELLKFLYTKCEALVRDTHFSTQERNTCTNRVQVQNKLNNKPVKTKPTTVFLTNITPSKPQSDKFKSQSTSTSEATSTRVVKCSYCSDIHSVNLCKRFAQAPVTERIEFAKANRLCFNCLKPSHVVKDCGSIFRCQKCRHRHHTLLHHDKIKNSTPYSTQSAASSNNNDQVRVLTCLGDDSNNSTVLLSTANVQIRDSLGNFHYFRALIDSGSQAHFITERAVRNLGIQSTPTSRCIRGLGHSSSAVSGTIRIEVGANYRSLFTIDALTLPSICGKMPSTRIDNSSWHHLQNLTLADPDCHKPGPIDLLLGAEVFSSLLLPGSVCGGQAQPSALNSVFGWLLLGNVSCKNAYLHSFFIKEDDLFNEEVKRLWELESFESSNRLTADEKLCEEIYTAQHTRDSTGRYVVALPFKEDKNHHSFPGSRDVALRCFYSIERKLLKNQELYEQYKEFMKDYLDSGHMSIVPKEKLKAGKYFIPHHCVIRPDSTTTKLRVVFNASCKDARGMSLNDTLLIGPKLQSNIVEILLKFRLHAVVFTADMRQMYRMILIDAADRDYQRIFWRFDTAEPVQEYQLNTVTYGVTSAPYLACRTIKQLVSDDGHDFPLASRVLAFDLYIDDIVTGFDSLELAQKAKFEIIELLKKGKIELRKWASNVPEFLTDIPLEHCRNAPVILDSKDNPTLKVLGLKWDPSSDCFLFAVSPQQRKCTKRHILSELARIYDPLGFLSPLTIIAKVLVQRLWILGVGWDEDPPADVVNFWNRYLEQLPLLKSLQISRCVSMKNIESCEIHGFSDSSETGYGAVVYLRTIDMNGDIKINFVCSKGRVAPIKSTSLPRLELCAAVLLADLLKFVIDIYSPVLPCTDFFAWSDSTVVLAWLRSHPSRWKAFVANRVGHILDVIPSARWGHVASEDNPADVVSRGQLPSALTVNRLWWAGPSWLSQPTSLWPRSDESPDADVLGSEEKNPHSFLTHGEANVSFIDSLLERYSSIRKVQRILCVWIEFVNFICYKRTRCSVSLLNRSELHNALMTIVKHVQSRHFSTEIRQLQDGVLLTKQMRKLNPFLDAQGILRVGGRLARSGLEFEHKHPALLPRESRLTSLLIEAFHRENCHAGVNTMQYLLTQQFWIVSSKRAIRHCLSKCLQCYKTKPVPLEPYMSDLPATRVNQVKPFSIVGTDYGGPFRIKFGNYRGAKIGKAYLCLFVCLSTKAVHLETVSDLSSDAFLAALRRFVGRRGRVSIIQSDCGTNYVGASNHLHSLMKFAARKENIEFRFNPPSSPHFGGVWEIQIKAVKSHLQRIVGDQALTFEELSTLFIQIESMLNSRPLCPLSSDPNDLSVLTPGHFLTLEPLTSVPDEDLTSLKINRLGRWQLIQRFQQDFWNRWRHEYLQTLTQRSKWTKHSMPLTVGSVVILKTEMSTPLNWPLARVEELHTSPDGVVRIATVRTASGSRLTRPLAKLCPLPNSTD